MASLPASMQAIKIQSVGVAKVESGLPLPAMADDMVLVKVAAVCLNPTDWKHLHVPDLCKPGHTLGCDFAGTVVAVGPTASRPLRAGDRVGGITHGSRSDVPESGSFAEYTSVPAHVLFKLPDGMSFEGGSTLGVAIATQGLGLYQNLGLPLPSAAAAAAAPTNPSPPPSPGPLFVYGASSAMGLSALEFAKLSGCSPIVAACSPRNFALVKARGADHAVDYKDPAACAAQVRAVVGDGLRLAYDCIGEGKSGDICAAALTSEPGVARYVALLYGASENFPRKDLALCHTILGYTVGGYAFWMGKRHFPAVPADAEYATMFVGLAERLLAEGRLTALPFEARPGRFDGVMRGMEAMRQGEVSGTKLVYAIEA